MEKRRDLKNKIKLGSKWPREVISIQYNPLKRNRITLNNRNVKNEGFTRK